MTDAQTGVVKFQSIGGGADPGPWHGLPVSTPYMTKATLKHSNYNYNYKL